MLKFTNTNKTSATFNGASFSLAAPEDWDSIGDGPTRGAVQAWLAEGNTPEPADVPDPAITIAAQITQLESLQMLPRIVREFLLAYSEGQYTPAQLAQNIGYTKLKAFDDQIVALRSQL